MKSIRIATTIFITLLLIASFIPMKSASAYSNLLADSGFESGVAGSWTMSGANAYHSQAQQHTDAWSLHLYADGGGSTSAYQEVTLSAGILYDLSYWVYWSGSGGAGYAGVDISTGTTGTAPTTDGPYTAYWSDVWYYVTGTFTPPTGGSYYVIPFMYHTNHTAYFDDITLTQHDFSTATYTITNTSQYSPTATATSTATHTPTNTATFTPTRTSSLPTPSPTFTYTITPTAVPGTTITWARADDVDLYLLNGMATYLLSNPPQGQDSGRIYGVADIQADGASWIVSVVNLAGVTSPYYQWSFENNVVWAGSLECTGADPNYICTLYQPVIGGEGTAGSALWPWRPGTKALYGVAGIHGAGSGFLPGSLSIDFVGADNWGSDIMPAEVYGAADGVITVACHDDHTAGIVVDSGAVGKFLYLHLNKDDTNLAIGNRVYAGKPISSLTYGAFGDYPTCPTTCTDGTDCKCGCAAQQNNQYHLHFATIPVEDYILIGGCQIHSGHPIYSSGHWSISGGTSIILCGTSNISTGGMITNSGSIPGVNPPNNTGGSTGGTIPSVGGEHIWNGLVNAVGDFIASMADAMFPEQHTPIGIATAVNNFNDQVLGVVIFFAGIQIFYLVPLFGFLALMLTLETIRITWIIYKRISGVIPDWL
jgi:hypothetical protein